jgi:hypothetical protein
LADIYKIYNRLRIPEDENLVGIMVMAESSEAVLQLPHRSIQASVKDLKLVAWELVVGPDGFV